DLRHGFDVRDRRDEAVARVDERRGRVDALVIDLLRGERMAPGEDGAAEEGLRLLSGLVLDHEGRVHETRGGQRVDEREFLALETGEIVDAAVGADEDLR